MSDLHHSGALAFALGGVRMLGGYYGLDHIQDATFKTLDAAAEWINARLSSAQLNSAQLSLLTFCHWLAAAVTVPKTLIMSSDWLIGYEGE